jgi:RNA polymerase sigma factor (sigma-70 family)
VTKAPFERIVAQHGATVLRVCRAVLGPHEAQDAWSDTFLAALRAYPDLADGANIQAWLVTIAHRKAIDITRARSRDPMPVESPPEQLSTAGIPEPGDGDVWADVAALPSKQRLAIAYHYLAGLPHQEVAEIIGGTTDAARRAAADGIKSLRRKYRLSARASRSAGNRPAVPSLALPHSRTPEPNGPSR